MASLSPSIKFSALDANGNPAAGWKVYTYEAGTSTPKSTYTTSAASVANANPVVLDSRGEATIWLSGTYKIRLTTAADVLVWEDDNVSDGTTNGTFTNASFAGTLSISSTSVTWSGNPTHSGNHTFSGNVSVNGNTTLGNASGDTLTVNPNAVTWSNNPTHSGTHTWSGAQTFSASALSAAATAVTWSGNPTHSGAHTWSGVQTYSADPAGRIIGGTYTPTITNVANIDSSTVSGAWNYIRIGSIVIASGQVSINTTAGASTATTFRVSLPVASNLANSYELSGWLQGGSSADGLLGIFGDSTNNEASCTFASGDTSNRLYSVQFMYVVI
jgi:hypothetical protein